MGQGAGSSWSDGGPGGRGRESPLSLFFSQNSGPQWAPVSICFTNRTRRGYFTSLKQKCGCFSKAGVLPALPTGAPLTPSSLPDTVASETETAPTLGGSVQPLLSGPPWPLLPMASSPELSGLCSPSEPPGTACRGGSGATAHSAPSFRDPSLQWPLPNSTPPAFQGIGVCMCMYEEMYTYAHTYMIYITYIYDYLGNPWWLKQ